MAKRANNQPKPTANAKAQAKIQKLRKRIDLIDKKILLLVRCRMNVVLMIGKVKQAHSIAWVQKNRLAEILRVRKRWGKQLSLKGEGVEKLFGVLHDESVRFQKQIPLEKVKVERNRKRALK